MRDLKQIAEELEAVLEDKPKGYKKSGQGWLFYAHYVGIHKRAYYSISVRHHEISEPEIEIAYITENRMLFKKMLKKIEPKCNILNKER
jgi:hypothetical protein